MRLEATIPDARGAAVQQLADQLGLSRSQIIDEALSLYLKAVMEVRRGRRLVTEDPSGEEPSCELTTPTLTTLEWAHTAVAVQLSDTAIAKLRSLVGEPPARPAPACAPPRDVAAPKPPKTAIGVSRGASPTGLRTNALGSLIFA